VNKQPFTTRLRVLRAEHQISQMEAARHLGCGHNRYWRIENGFQEPTTQEKALLAALFKSRVSDIFPKVAA
jgi:DNA-binding XRE family transcriptional regulator